MATKFNYSTFLQRIKYYPVSILFFIALNLNAQLNGNYIIGTGGDFKNFTEAAAELNKVGVSGLVTFEVVNGIYEEQFTLGVISNTSLARRVIFKSQSGNPNDVVLQFAADLKDANYIVKLQGSQYIEFRNLGFNATGLGRAIELDLAATNIVITGCDFSGIYNTGSGVDPALIYSVNPDIENINITDNNFGACSYGIYFQGVFNNSIEGLRIMDNTFSNTGYTSISLNGADDPLISGNTIEKGLLGMQITSGVSSLTIVKNKVNTTSNGIKVNFPGNTLTGLIANNFIVVNGVSESHGLDIQNSTHMDVYHNSVMLNTINSDAHAFHCYSNIPGTIRLVNNTFSCMNEGYAAYVQYPAAIIQSDCNNYYSPSSMMFYWGGKLYDLAELKSLGDHDQHSVSVYPGHLSETDLHAKTLWMAGKGIPVAEVTDDIDGQTRDTQHPDIGADEYSFTMFLPPFSGDIVVGPGHTYESLQSIIDDLKIRGISSNVWLRLTPGIHDEQAELVTIPGSGPDKKINITTPLIFPATDSVVLRNDASGADDNYILKLTGADFISIKGITFHADNATYSRIIELNGGADSVTISNNKFNANSYSGNDGRKASIISENGYYVQRLVENNTFYGNSYGILMTGVSAYFEFSNGAIIQGNSMHNLGYTGINLQTHHSPVVKDNNIFGGYYGISLSQCDGLYEITKNKLDIKGQYGIRVTASDGYLVNPAVISNNFIHVGGTGNAYGIYLSSSDYLNIYYNSVNITSKDMTDGRGFYCSSGSNIRVYNDIFMNTGGGYAYYVTTSSAISGSDYNDFYTTGTNLAYFNGVKTNLAELQSGNSYHDHCLSVDPGFVSYNDLHVTNDDLSAAATPIVSISDDIDEDTRHLTTPDIGADEFSGGGGVGLFSELPLDLPGIRYGKAIWGDYNTDGKLDIIMSGNYLSAIYRNAGSNVFYKAPDDLLYVNNADISWTDNNFDNQPDLFLTGTSPTGLRAAVMYENESGTFSSVDTEMEGLWNAESEWADFDNDGDKDLLITGQTDNSLGFTRIYFYEDANFLDWNGNYNETEVGEDVIDGSVAIADYDRDGDFDFVLSGILGTDRITRLYKNINGEFVQTEDLFTGVNGGALAWGDYDSDGDLDLLISGYDGITGYITKLYENDEGGFYDTHLPFIGFVNADAEWADYDSDGDLDLLICGSTDMEHRTTLYSNNHGESFTPVDAGLPGVDFGSVAWGDCDRDGDLDILLCGNTDGTAVTKVFVNNGTDQGSVPQGPSNLLAQIADKNAMLSWDPGSDNETQVQSLTYNLRIFRGLPSGELEVISPLALGDGTGMTVGMGNMQGNTRFRINGLTPGTTYYWEVQTIDQTYRSSAFMDGGYFTTLDQIYTGVQIISGDKLTYGEMDFGDYDNDGDMDMFICGNINKEYDNDTRATEIYTNNNGIFTRLDLELKGVDQCDAEWGDYDNDGDLDFIFAGRHDAAFYDETTTLIYENLGGGSFGRVDAGITSIRTGVVTWGDCDNDGDLDILVSGCHGSDNQVTEIYINKGMNRFEPLETELPGFRYNDGAWGDYDNDGDLDFILSGDAQVSGWVTKIYENHGNYAFSPIASNFPGLKDGAVEWGDYDHDGDLDLVLSGRVNWDQIEEMFPDVERNTSPMFFDQGITIIYKNQGGDRFEPLPITLPRVLYSSVQWGDYDVDGDLDLLLTGELYGSGVTKIFRNEGNDLFVDSDIILPGVHRGCARWVDWNGDGTLDLVMFGNGVENVGSYRNNIQISNTAPSAPENLRVSLDGSEFSLQWNSSTDEQTPAEGLSYNLRIGTAPGTGDVKAPMADNNGHRKIVRIGNVNQVNSWTLNLENLAEVFNNNSGLYWSVQAIDNGFLGSEFAPEDTIGLSGKILQITDVPYDQGGKVTLRWQASGLDINNSFLSYYSIWRAIPTGTKASFNSVEMSALKLSNKESVIRATESKGETVYWEWVANQPAHKLPIYAYTCSTVNDSLKGNPGTHQFMISAHTSDPNVYFDSDPATGYSVDNLAPTAPSDLKLANKGATVDLSWDLNTEKDLKQYLVYRSTIPEIDPLSSDPVALVTDTLFSDTNLPGHGDYYYIVCAEDIHNNISDPSNQVMTTLTDTFEDILLPGTNILNPAYPNPFTNSTLITFNLSENAEVCLEIYTLNGVKMATLINHELPAGSHSYKWEPSGNLPKGIYFCLLKAGRFHSRIKLVMLGSGGL